MKVKDASNWKPRYRVAFDAEKPLPNFNVTGRIEEAYRSGDAWTIKLSGPRGFSRPAGTKIVAMEDTTNGIFPCLVDAVPNAWTEISGDIPPETFKRWPGVKYASVTVLPKLPADKKVAFFMDDLALKRIADASPAR